MKRDMLDLLYQEINDAKALRDSLLSVKVFQGCDKCSRGLGQEAHDEQIKAAVARINFADSLIDAYVDAHAG